MFASLVGNNVYRLGSQGPVVQAIQQGLAGLGYQLKGTGYYGPATDTAVSTFQRRSGIAADGRFGRITASALDAAVSPAPGHAAAPHQTVAQKEIRRPLWLEAGMALIGTHESPGAADNPVIIDWAKEEGGDIAKEYTHDVIPWCALFINHIFTKVGIKGTETLWALDWEGKWPSIRLAGPAVGAVAPMLRDGGGHVITVVGRTSDGYVAGLGGNQSDAVSIARFPQSRLNRGFWWPNSVPVPVAVGFEDLPVVDLAGHVSTGEA